MEVTLTKDPDEEKPSENENTGNQDQTPVKDEEKKPQFEVADKDKELTQKSVKTGDSMPAAMYGVGALMAAVAAAFICVERKRR